MQPLVAGISKIKGLKSVHVDFSRAKVETEAFAMLAEAISMHNLESLSFDVESMKINPQNVAHIAGTYEGQSNLSRVDLNFNFNEVDVDDIQLVTQSLQDTELDDLKLRFKGCRLPRDAFAVLCQWMEAGMELEDTLYADFTM